MPFNPCAGWLRRTTLAGACLLAFTPVWASDAPPPLHASIPEPAVAVRGEPRAGRPSGASAAEGKGEGKAESKGEAKGEGKGEGKAEAKPSRGESREAAPPAEAEAPKHAGPKDPMVMLRERLAKRLGTIKAADPRQPNELRIVTKAEADAEAAAARPRPSAHRARAHAPARVDEPAAPPHASHWAYGGAEGPEIWGQLKPEFMTCNSGSRQSPIDIHDGIHVDLEPVHFEYRPSSFRVVDTGHTVQVNVGPGNWIEVMGRRYELQQFHFHRPSEDRINGQRFDMEAHLVHKDMDGHLAVVAVLLTHGAAQALIQTVWNNLPLEKGDETAPRGEINLNELLPEDRRYFTYMGSLTTPPCSEGVLWMVMKRPVTLSDAQIDIFARLYPMNARPVQPSAGRLIKESN